MNARQRLLQALSHSGPDRVPLDLGSTQVTGIHVVAYRRLCSAPGLLPDDSPLCDAIQQLALPGDGVIGRPGVGVRGLFPLNSHNCTVREEDSGHAWLYHNEWGKALAPGGGFVFGPIHNIQADIPPENVLAMVEALHEYGAYR